MTTTIKDSRILQLANKALNSDNEEMGLRPGYCIGNNGYKNTSVFKGVMSNIVHYNTPLCY